MTTDKKHIQHLAAICAKKGIEYVVISPGSRCAPLIIAFQRIKEIQCISIIDERSAAFVALGIAQQSGKAVALVCTSGSAMLNYAPAIAEAYYQKIPLLVLSADRPNEWIDQGENQSILQYEAYKNYIKKSFQLPLQIHTEKDLWYSDRIVSEAINTAIYPDFGPVHINIPLREPLYNLVEDEACDPKIVAFSRPLYSLQESELELLIKEWKSYERILLVVGGFREKNPNLESLLQKLAKQNNLIILKEAIANVDGEDFIDQIDPCIELIQEHKLHDFAPDLILTLGGGLVSKKLKFWLRDQKTLAHWHLTKSFEHWDNFQALTRVLQLDPVLFFSRIVGETTETSSNYKEKWLELRSFCADFSKHYLAQNGFTDFKVFEFLLKNLPENSLLQLGNSTPVRYANLLRIESNKNFQMNANRGVSGIDGVLSTAAGASLVKSDKLCFCITGDIAALYDSNALLNLQLKANFKLIIINNGGGNIFRIIPGPSSLDELEQFFETKQDISFEHLALTYKLKYFFASSLASLEELFPAFISEQQLGVILEIKTDGELSANFLKNFFKELRLSKYKN